MSTKCRVKRTFPRPERALVEALRGISAADVADCLDGDCAVGSALMPMNAAPLLGAAFTVTCPPGDNLMFHLALDLARPGDVVVVTGGDPQHALCGELMAAWARTRGLAGFVVDGCVRDREALSQLTDFPVYARGTAPAGPTGVGPGEINHPVAVCGVTVRPGDVLVGDGDGIAVIPREKLAETAERAAALARRNRDRLERILSGEGFSRPGAEAALAALEMDYTDEEDE